MAKTEERIVLRPTRGPRLRSAYPTIVGWFGVLVTGYAIFASLLPGEQCSGGIAGDPLRCRSPQVEATAIGVLFVLPVTVLGMIGAVRFVRWARRRGARGGFGLGTLAAFVGMLVAALLWSVFLLVALLPLSLLTRWG